jgi:hypothetical protein
VRSAARRSTRSLGCMRVKAIDYRLDQRSALLRSRTWRALPQGDLKGLIQRFATRESQGSKRGRSCFLWKRRRLAAVTVYRQRFGSVPEIFSSIRLPRIRSYYMKDGQYIWPLQPNNTLQAMGEDARA